MLFNIYVRNLQRYLSLLENNEQEMQTHKNVKNLADIYPYWKSLTKKCNITCLLNDILPIRAIESFEFYKDKINKNHTYLTREPPLSPIMDTRLQIRSTFKKRSLRASSVYTPRLKASSGIASRTAVTYGLLCPEGQRKT